MIESNIINWIDLGDSMQSLDIYGKKKMIKFFNFIRVLTSLKKFFYFLLHHPKILLLPSDNDAHLSQLRRQRRLRDSNSKIHLKSNFCAGNHHSSLNSKENYVKLSSMYITFLD